MKNENILKPCPLCGQPVSQAEKVSVDRSLVWITIFHSPHIPCGISFVGIKENAVEKWNNRVKYETTI